MYTKIGGRKICTHDDYLGKRIAEDKEYYEIDYLKFCIEKKRKGTILDIGANIGNHSMYWALKGEKVIAFEPSDDNYALLVKNTYNLNVETHKVALSNKIIPYVVTQPNPNNRGVDSIVEDKNNGGALTALLDNYDFIDNIALIKLDVEGMELQVLQGGFLTLQRFLPDLMVEINNTETMQYILHLGYKRIFSIERSKNVYFRHKIYG